MAFLLGVLSHIILDAIPHLDPGTFNKTAGEENKPWPVWIYLVTALEFIILMIVFIWLFSDRSDFHLLVWGGAGGLTIDILDNHPFHQIRKLPFFKQLHLLHEFIHYDLHRDKWYWGVLTSIIIAGGSIWYLLKF